jgi:hypothetical protein
MDRSTLREIRRELFISVPTIKTADALVLHVTETDGTMFQDQADCKFANFTTKLHK